MNNLNQTQRVVLYDRDGKEQHFDVSINFQKIAQTCAQRAMRNKSHRSVVAGGAVKVEHIP